VLNECLTKDGTVDSAKGEAKVVDNSSNTKLKVRFAPAFLSAFGFVWGDYWVIDLGRNYEYSVVGDPKREYLWVLSRTPELPEPTYQGILRRVRELGFDPHKLQKTTQRVETVKGAAIKKH
jgi:apolipoprotein D and lipocalin family protein